MVSQHHAGRTEYGVTINDDVENVEQQSKHVLVFKPLFQIFAHRRVCQGLPGRLDQRREYTYAGEECIYVGGEYGCVGG